MKSDAQRRSVRTSPFKGLPRTRAGGEAGRGMGSEELMKSDAQRRSIRTFPFTGEELES